jgi:hypothetical protein
LFTIGKFLIDIYDRIRLWRGPWPDLPGALRVYYSGQTSLLGAEFTRVYAHHHGSSAK